MSNEEKLERIRSYLTGIAYSDMIQAELSICSILYQDDPVVLSEIWKSIRILKGEA